MCGTLNIQNLLTFLILKFHLNIYEYLLINILLIIVDNITFIIKVYNDFIILTVIIINTVIKDVRIIIKIISTAAVQRLLLHFIKIRKVITVEIKKRKQDLLQENYTSLCSNMTAMRRKKIRIRTGLI